MDENIVTERPQPTARMLVAIAIFRERYEKATTSPQIFWEECVTTSERRHCRQIAEEIRNAKEA